MLKSVPKVAITNIHKTHRLYEKPIGRRCPWQYCAYCGLTTLRNEATLKEFRKPCRGNS